MFLKIASSLLLVLVLTLGIQQVAVSDLRSAVTLPNTVLTSVYMLSSTDGWAVGEEGTIIRWDGSYWSTVVSPTEDFLMSVHMLSSADGWAVGFPRHPGWAVGINQGSTIIRWDGSSWSNVTSPTTNSLYSVDMVSATEGWAVGYRGTIIRWDGSSWSNAASPTQAHLYSVSMLSSSDGWAVGEGGTIIRWNGSSWSAVTSPTRDFLMSVHMLSPTDGWAVGQGGTIIRWDGLSWTTATSPTRSTLYSICMVSATDGWAVGYGGTIIRWDGSSWSNVENPARSLLLSVYTVSPTDGWAVGEGGQVLAFPPVPNQPPVITNPRVEGQTNPTYLETLTPQLNWDYVDADNHAQERFRVQVGTAEGDNSLWDYVSPDWKDLDGEVYYEPFDNLDNFDFDNPGQASVEIDPPGQLHYNSPGVESWGHVRGWEVPNNFTFEIRTYFDRIDGGMFYNLIMSATIQFAVGFKEEGLLIVTGHTDVPNWDFWDLILPGAVKYGEDAEWQLWRLVVTGDDWETASCDIYLTDSAHANQLMAADVACPVPLVPHGASSPLSYETGGQAESHIDYARITSNDSGVKITAATPAVTYAGAELSPGVTYHWRVKCYDGQDWSDWASGTFQVNAEATSTPTPEPAPTPAPEPEPTPKAAPEPTPIPTLTPAPSVPEGINWWLIAGLAAVLIMGASVYFIARRRHTKA